MCLISGGARGRAALEDWARGPPRWSQSHCHLLHSTLLHAVSSQEQGTYILHFWVASILPRAQHGAQETYIVEETKSLGGAGVRMCAARDPRLVLVLFAHVGQVRDAQKAPWDVTSWILSLALA